MASTYHLPTFNGKERCEKANIQAVLRPMIFSEKIQNGGAPSSEVYQYKKERALDKKEKQERRALNGGRTKRLIRKILFRNKDGNYSPVSSERYLASTGSSYPSPITRQQGSMIPADHNHLSRRRSRRRSHHSEVAHVSHVAHRRTSVRSNPYGNRRSQMVEYSDHTDRPRRHQSFRNGQHCQSGGFQNLQHDLMQTPLVQARSSIGGRDSEVLADYLSRPTLPTRPGASYRDGIDQWRQNVPVEVR